MSNKEIQNEGIFGAAKKFSDAFFDGLKSNATNKAIEAAKKNKQVPSQLVNKMSELEQLAKELKADLEKYS
jgi:flagellar biosynthesis regulator FlaF